MNLIIENSKYVRQYTDMSEVMRWLGNPSAQYDWLISDLQGGFSDIKVPCLMMGDELTKRLTGPVGQVTWGVFSALPRGTKPKMEKAPFADGNRALWQGNAKPQLKEAVFEIVCWDSSAILFIGLPDELSKRLKAAIPDAKDLDTLRKS